jgi:nucleoside-diphosphate-sugar epimerase
MTFCDDKQILITDSAGFLGSHIVEQLHQMGVKDTQLSIPRSKDLDLRK